METSNTVLKFAIYSVLELFNKTTGEDFNSIAGGIILSKLVSAKMVRVKELGPSHHTKVIFMKKSRPFPLTPSNLLPVSYTVRHSLLHPTLIYAYTIPVITF